MEKENETTRAAEQEPAQTRADLGKFRSVEALLNAYNSLEAEFTRRSQRLRELEGKLAKNESAAAADENGQPSAPRASSEVSENTAEPSALNTLFLRAANTAAANAAASAQRKQYQKTG